MWGLVHLILHLIGFDEVEKGVPRDLIPIAKDLGGDYVTDQIEGASV